jgi:hypothetical protein
MHALVALILVYHAITFMPMYTGSPYLPCSLHIMEAHSTSWLLLVWVRLERCGMECGFDLH